jgi:hypothetical protein
MLAAAAGVLCGVDAACAVLVRWKSSIDFSADGEWYLGRAVRCSGAQIIQLFLTQCS